MFTGAADAYDRYMGRYSIPLAPLFADFAGVEVGQRVLDVGCGPGALTGELVARLGAESVAAVEPSEGFAAAARQRHPGVDIRNAPAERLPFPDGAFDAALAQLVVHFMEDPTAGIGELRRVTRPGGVVAACVWDHAGDTGPLSPLWVAARALDPGVDDESELAGAREGDLGERFRAAGLADVEETALEATVEHGSFEAWWEPLTLGVGPGGSYVGRLDAERQAELRARVELPERALTVRAWAARGRA